MLRRCLDSPNPAFGMIMPPRPGSNATVDYGTMLQIKSVQMLADGRSMVETWGTYRFRILERGVLDGYMVGRIERVEDFLDDSDASDGAEDTEEENKEDESSTPPLSPAPSTSATPSTSSSMSSPIAIPRRRRNTHPSSSLPSLSINDLVTHCFAFLNTLRTGTPWISQRLSRTYGYDNGVYGPYGVHFTKDSDGNVIIPLQPSINDTQGENPSHTPPFDIAGFSFWVGAVLPIDEWEKAKLLPVRSVKMRLQMCLWFIEGFRRQWWFHNGCIIL